MLNKVPELIDELDQFSLTSALESLPDGILLLDEKGEVLFVNRKFTDITGYRYHEFIGLSHIEVVSLLLAKTDLDYSMIWDIFQKAFYAYLKQDTQKVQWEQNNHHDADRFFSQ